MPRSSARRPPSLLGLLLTALLTACQPPPASPAPPAVSKPIAPATAAAPAAAKPVASPSPLSIAASPSPTLRQSVAPSPAAAPAASSFASPSPVAIQTGSVQQDLAALQRIQQEVDQGHMPWRLDPLEVVREESPKLGFSPTDRLELISQAPGTASGTTQALVRATHAGRAYEIQLIQPVRTGKNGIWSINDVRLAR